jgi:hypothetical protein
MPQTSETGCRSIGGSGRHLCTGEADQVRNDFVKILEAMDFLKGKFTRLSVRADQAELSRKPQPRDYYR